MFGVIAVLLNITFTAGTAMLVFFSFVTGVSLHSLASNKLTGNAVKCFSCHYSATRFCIKWPLCEYLIIGHNICLYVPKYIIHMYVHLFIANVTERLKVQCSMSFIVIIKVNYVHILTEYIKISSHIETG